MSFRVVFDSEAAQVVRGLPESVRDGLTRELQAIADMAERQPPQIPLGARMSDEPPFRLYVHNQVVRYDVDAAAKQISVRSIRPLSS